MKRIILLSACIAVSILSQSQNVGIGTATPAAKLEIRHASTFSSPNLLLYNTTPTDYARLQLQNASGNKFWHVAGYIDDVTNANSRLNFFHSTGGDIMSLTGDGKAGIGTLYPSEKLSVLTGNNSYGFSHSNGAVKLASYIGSGTGFFGTASNHPLSFFTSDNVVTMFLNTAGNVGIGSITPAHRTHIAANSVHAGLVQLNLEETEEDFSRLRFQNSVVARYWEIGALPKTADVDAQMNFYYNNSGVVLSLSGDGNVIANNFKYQAPKTLFHSTSGINFRTTAITDNIQLAYAQGYCWMINGTNPILAPVHLPQNAVITSFIVYFTDNHASENLIVRLRKGQGVTSISQLMAEIISSGTPGNTILIDNTILFNQVDNIGNFYFITAESSTGTWTDASMVINQIQINYTVAGPD